MTLNICKKIKEKAKTVFHPVRITGNSLILSAAGTAALASPVTQPLTIPFYLAASVSDGLDGYVARATNQCSKEGAALDPFVDKIRDVFPYAFMIAKQVALGDYITPAVIATNIAVNAKSQIDRGSPWQSAKDLARVYIDPNTCTQDTEKKSSLRANYWGKVKTCMQIGAQMAYVGEHVYNSELSTLMHINPEMLHLAVTTGSTMAIGVATVCGAIGVYKRSKIKNEINTKNINSASLEQTVTETI